MINKLPREVKANFLGWTKEAWNTKPKLKCPACNSEMQSTGITLYECLLCDTIINLSRPGYDILYIKTGRQDRTYTPQSFMEEEKLIVKEWNRTNQKKEQKALIKKLKRNEKI